MRTYSDYLEVRWSKTLIDELRGSSDPRLSLIAEVPQDGVVNNSDQSLPGNTDPNAQIGLPNGYDLQGAETDIRNSSVYPGGTGIGIDLARLGRYSRPRTSVYLKLGGPIFLITYAETELLLAEAKVRGWNIAGTAKEHFANGVNGAMQSLSQLDASATVDPLAIESYISRYPLDDNSLENSLKSINTQYWIATGTNFNFIESWLNWKRSDYPKLTPVSYKGNVTNGRIPRRMIYLSTEILNNTENYRAAVDRLEGGDVLTSRVWWDR